MKKLKKKRSRNRLKFVKFMFLKDVCILSNKY